MASLRSVFLMSHHSAAEKPAVTDAAVAKPDPLLLSAEALGELLQVSERSVWRLRSAGKLPRPVRVGGSIRWRKGEIRRWVEAGCPSLKEWDARQQR